MSYALNFCVLRWYDDNRQVIINTKLLRDVLSDVLNAKTVGTFLKAIVAGTPLNTATSVIVKDSLQRLQVLFTSTGVMYSIVQLVTQYKILSSTPSGINPL